MNKGKYVFSQIMTYFPRWIFEDSVKKYKGDFHAKNLKEYGDKIPAEKKTAIETAMNSLKEAVKAQNIADIEKYNAELEAAWHAASEDMAKAAQAGPQPGAQGPFNGQAGPQGGADDQVDEQ